jgi:hypothetical protein
MMDWDLAPVGQPTREVALMRYELSDNECSIIRALLPTKPRGVPLVDDRRVLDAECEQPNGGKWSDVGPPRRAYVVITTNPCPPMEAHPAPRRRGVSHHHGRVRLCVSDLASYVAGSGSFQGVFMNDPRVIGVVEAHGLAILTGVAGFAHLSSSGRSYWHLHFATTHLLFGGANIAFFGVFSMVQAVLMGTVVTVIHFVFAGAQVIAFRGYSGEGFAGQAARSQ